MRKRLLRIRNDFKRSTVLPLKSHLGFQQKYHQKLHLESGKKLWWPGGTNNRDTSRRKCAIVFGPTSATYEPLSMLLTPVTRDTYRQPWLTVWSGNSVLVGQIFPPDYFNCWPGGHLSPFHQFCISICVFVNFSFQCVCLVSQLQASPVWVLSHHNLCPPHHHNDQLCAHLTTRMINLIVSRQMWHVFR